MTEKTAYVVMLPLTDEQHDIVYHTTRNSGDEAAIRAIGTPVDSSVPVVGHEWEYRYWADEDGRGKYVWEKTFTVAGPENRDRETWRNSFPLIRQSDHLAALAEKQAEVERLRGVIKLLELDITHANEKLIFEKQCLDECKNHKDIASALIKQKDQTIEALLSGLQSLQTP